jgi:hypothetical protein
MLLYTGIKKHTYSTILFASRKREHNARDKLPFWKPTTLGATPSPTRKLHQRALGTPRSVPDSPNVELQTLPKPIGQVHTLVTYGYAMPVGALYWVALASMASCLSSDSFSSCTRPQQGQHHDARQSIAPLPSIPRRSRMSIRLIVW